MSSQRNVTDHLQLHEQARLKKTSESVYGKVTLTLCKECLQNYVFALALNSLQPKGHVDYRIRGDNDYHEVLLLQFNMKIHLLNRGKGFVASVK